MHVDEIKLARYELRCSACNRFVGELFGEEIRLRIRCTGRDCRCWNWFKVHCGVLTTGRARAVVVDKAGT